MRILLVEDDPHIGDGMALKDSPHHWLRLMMQRCWIWVCRTSTA